MDRMIYPRELVEPDIRWLLANYKNIDRSLIMIADDDQHVSLVVFSDSEMEKLKALTKISPIR
ncbi:MAG: hypothetical protein NZO16_00555 [Deltaproteobacteria bacterium]|nr:hypothetical protein [Deltaproteobacteria bacterium]